MPILLKVSEAQDGKHKFNAIFKMPDGRYKTVAFGAKGMMDYIQYYKESPVLAHHRRQAYLLRHKANENWNDRTSPGALSRWLLWEKPTLEGAIQAFRKRFP